MLKLDKICVVFRARTKYWTYETQVLFDVFVEVKKGYVWRFLEIRKWKIDYGTCCAAFSTGLW